MMVSAEAVSEEGRPEIGIAASLSDDVDMGAHSHVAETRRGCSVASPSEVGAFGVSALDAQSIQHDAAGVVVGGRL